MCEWLKQSVLKTDVRETVPGVRIPLPPPRSLGCREFPPLLSVKYANNARFLQFLLDKPDRRRWTARWQSSRSPQFSLQAAREVRLSESATANTKRSKTEPFANGDLTLLRVNECKRLFSSVDFRIARHPTQELVVIDTHPTCHGPIFKNGIGLLH
jgi:hypothetical protein